jgi:hypothetical protein
VASETKGFMHMASYHDPSTSAGKGETKEVPMRFSNVERGCEWEGTVDTLECHVAKCGSMSKQVQRQKKE